MLTWPHSQSDWADQLEAVEQCYLALASAICQRQKLLVACFDEAHRQYVEQRLQQQGVDPGSVRLAVAPGNDTWARDHGPLTVLCQQDITLLDFRFNGWGNKYPAELDNAITSTLYHQQALGDTLLEPIDMVLEGGSIEVDGSGTLLTTKRCLLAPNRNPGLSQQQIEQRLCHWFGLTRILWLEHGALDGDDTDSHIDILARFCDRDTIAYQACDDENDTHFAELQAMQQQLASFKTITGEPYRLMALPWPAAIYDHDGRRLAASYANFVIINHAVLVPCYDDPADARAQAVLQQCFPDRDIIGINALPLIQQGGSLHCITMQLPVGVLP